MYNLAEWALGWMVTVIVCLVRFSLKKKFISSSGITTVGLVFSWHGLLINSLDSCYSFSSSVFPL